MQFNRIFVLSLGCLLLSLSTLAHAEKLTIAAASDLKFALDETVNRFLKNNPRSEIKVIYGSSGKLYTQIQQGAPYDIYFSADISYPDRLVDEGYAKGPAIPYAVGRIVLWAPDHTLDAAKMTLENLLDPGIKRIAIANPKHAPYGKRAEEALKAKGIWSQLEHKLIYGENVSQTAQFALTRNAEIGIIALSLAISNDLDKQGSYYLIPDTLHTPLEQGFIITKIADHNLLAKKFANFMSGTEAKKIREKYGFMLPKEHRE